MSVLDRIWPWSRIRWMKARIRLLEDQVAEQRRLKKSWMAAWERMTERYRESLSAPHSHPER